MKERSKEDRQGTQNLKKQLKSILKSDEKLMLLGPFDPYFLTWINFSLGREAPAWLWSQY